MAPVYRRSKPPYGRPFQVVDLSGLHIPHAGRDATLDVVRDRTNGEVLFDCLGSKVPCGTGRALSEKCALVNSVIMRHGLSVREYVDRKDGQGAYFVVFFHEKSGNVYPGILRAECIVDEEGNARITLRIRTKDQECKEPGTTDIAITLIPLIGDKMQRAYYEITAEAKVEQLPAIMRAVNSAGARLYRLKEYGQRLFDNNPETEALKRGLGVSGGIIYHTP